jgi:hypothetical protein
MPKLEVIASALCAGGESRMLAAAIAIITGTIRSETQRRDVLVIM